MNENEIELLREIGESVGKQLVQSADLMELLVIAFRRPIGTRLSVEHDGFEGTIIGYYRTREGKPGLVLQQDNTRIVHVYGEKWFQEDVG